MRLEVGSMLTRITLAAIVTRCTATASVSRTRLSLCDWCLSGWLVVFAVHAFSLVLLTKNQLEEIHQFHRSMLSCRSKRQSATNNATMPSALPPFSRQRTKRTARSVHRHQRAPKCDIHQRQELASRQCEQ